MILGTSIYIYIYTIYIYIYYSTYMYLFSHPGVDRICFEFQNIPTETGNCRPFHGDIMDIYESPRAENGTCWYIFLANNSKTKGHNLS